MLDLYVTKQPHYKRGKAVLNYPIGRGRTPGMIKDHWLRAKTPKHLVSIRLVFPGVPRYLLNGFLIRKGLGL